MASQSAPGRDRAGEKESKWKAVPDFRLLRLKQWPVRKVAKELRVSVAQVYLAKHRLGALLKKEVGRLERAR